MACDLSQCLAAIEHAQRTLDSDTVTMLADAKRVVDSLRSAHRTATYWVVMCKARASGHELLFETTEEEEETIGEYGEVSIPADIKEEDVTCVMEQCKVSRQIALDSIRTNDGDVVSAVSLRSFSALWIFSELPRAIVSLHTVVLLHVISLLS